MISREETWIGTIEEASRMYDRLILYYCQIVR
jgi:hypothetical protein